MYLHSIFDVQLIANVREMRDYPLILILFSFLMLYSGIQESIAQTFNKIDGSTIPKVFIKKSSDRIHLDGALTERTWIEVSPATNFTQIFPVDSVNAQGATEVYMAFDDHHLYVGVKCYSKSNAFITPSLRRDYDFFGNDNFTLLLDTYNDKNSALAFGINPFGVRREATIANGGQKGGDFDESWDNKWDGNATIYEDHWIAELAIPFKTLRYTEGSTQWRFNAYRYDTQNNEISTWIQIPQNRFTIDLGFMGDMIWEEPLKKPSKNISIIPYATSSLSRDFEDKNQLEPKQIYDIGGDAKIGLTSGLNLDLTINPDFSQVEVDEQVTNLDRFEIQFPEKRQFFLENADLFGSFAANRLNPFFSRRIGVSIDTATGQNIQNTILYGARLSGKLNDRFRVGLLNMQSAKQVENGTPGFNYTVATAEQRVFDRSGIALMVVNKEAVDKKSFTGGNFNAYNRLVGLEYRLASADNKWIGKSSILKTFSPGIEQNDYSHYTQVIYTNRRHRFEWVHIYVGNGYNPEVGFAPRKDFFMVSPEASVNFYPSNNKKISQHTLGFDMSLFYKIGQDNNEILEKFSVEEFNFNPFWRFRFSNSSDLTLRADYSHLTLLRDFDPTRIQNKAVFLPAGSSYSYTRFGLSFQSDRRSTFNYSVAPSVGTFYNGFRTGVKGSFTYRYQPYGFISLAYTYNRIKLDAPFKVANLWLVGPRIDFTFTKKLFLTTFFQYNNQLDNLNINARFQWRFKPVSDFFIVYTDNYLTDPFNQFGSRNRALVAKMTYWFNL